MEEMEERAHFFFDILAVALILICNLTAERSEEPRLSEQALGHVTEKISSQRSQGNSGSLVEVRKKVHFQLRM